MCVRIVYSSLKSIHLKNAPILPFLLRFYIIKKLFFHLFQTDRLFKFHLRDIHSFIPSANKKKFFSFISFFNNFHKNEIFLRFKKCIKFYYFMCGSMWEIFESNEVWKMKFFNRFNRRKYPLFINFIHKLGIF